MSLRDIKGLILTLSVLLSGASLHAQSRIVEFGGGSLTVKKALRKIEQQTGYRFAYNNGELDIYRTVELPYAGMEVSQALAGILEGTGLIGAVNGNHIVLVKVQAAGSVEEGIVPAGLSAGSEEAVFLMPGRDAPDDSFIQKRPLPRFALKINLPYAATSTLNMAFEMRLSNRLTLDVPVGYNPWTFRDNKKIRHIMVQPELRYWLNDPFRGHFWGAHLHYAFFNVGGIKLPFGQLPLLVERRYQGDLFGAGISYGYNFTLSDRFTLETTLGAGYARMDYAENDCMKCGGFIGWGTRDYFGITRLGISFVWIIR